MSEPRETFATFTYAGRPVPIRPRDGYINVTALCDVEGKRAQHILGTAEAKRYIALVSQKAGIAAISLVEARQRSGTWAHPLVASFVAERLSPEAAFFVHNTLQDLHLVGVVTELAERDAERRIAERIAAGVNTHLQTSRRKEVSASVRDLHLRCVRSKLKSQCPGCVDKADEWHIDHFRHRNDPSLESTWPLCPRCNLKREGRRSPQEHKAEHARFDAYQANLENFRKTERGDDMPLFAGALA